jgi:hypothetical protein
MAIIRMGGNDYFPADAGAYCPLSDNVDRVKKGFNPIVLWTEDEGLCLHEYEVNGYDDSDFYMVVWDEEQCKPINKMFATTRGWSYPCYGSSADATDEVRAKYDEWKKENERRKRIVNKWNRRSKLIETANRWRMSRKEATRVLNAISKSDREAMDALLRVRNFRSNFRRNLAEQVRGWAREENPRYATPLSKKQMQYL